MAAKPKPKAKRNVMANIADLLRQKLAARNAPPPGAGRSPMMPGGGAPMPPDSMTPGAGAMTQ